MTPYGWGWVLLTGCTGLYFVVALAMIGLDGPAGWAVRHRPAALAMTLGGAGAIAAAWSYLLLIA